YAAAVVALHGLFAELEFAQRGRGQRHKASAALAIHQFRHRRRAVLLDGAVAGKQRLIELGGLLFDVGAHGLERLLIALELLVVDRLELVVLLLGPGGAHADLLLLAVAGLGVLAHLGKLLLVARERVGQALRGLGAAVALLHGGGRVRL